jgi:hypothetical protein
MDQAFRPFRKDKDVQARPNIPIRDPSYLAVCKPIVNNYQRPRPIELINIGEIDPMLRQIRPSLCIVPGQHSDNVGQWAMSVNLSGWTQAVMIP